MMNFITRRRFDQAVGTALRKGWPQDPYAFAETFLEALDVELEGDTE